MAFKSFLLLGIFLVVASKVSSYDEDLKIQGTFVKPPVPAAVPPPKPTPSPSPPVVTVPPPPQVKAPYVPPVKVPPPPLVKSPPYPPVKGPSPPPQPVKAPTPPAPVKVPPPPYPPVVKPPLAPSPPPPPTPMVKSKKECIPLCAYRCQLHSRTNVCNRACLTCCDRCKCVPPGTYGNREKCGKCYTDMLTHGNRIKCP